MERFGSDAVLWHDHKACPTIGRAFVRLLRDERAAATVEFVLWVPVFMFIILAAIDATVLYLHHTEMWNVSRDVARRVAVGDIDETQALQIVADELFLYTDSTAYSVDTSNPSDPDVMILIQTPVADADFFGIFQPVLDEYLEAAVIMRREPI